MIALNGLGDQAPEPDPSDDDLPIIHHYSRAQALANGVLIDISEWATDLGFVIPVACTAAVWHDWVTPPENAHALGQCERGRAHDLLFMLACAIRRSRDEEPSQRLSFTVEFRQSAHIRKQVEFHAVCGPGDAGEPVLTILLPAED